MHKFIIIFLLITVGICEASEKTSYAGTWISKNYHEKLKETKSPKKAQRGSKFIVIPKESSKSVIMIYQFHEGVKTSYDSLKINKLSDNSIEIDGESFIKIDSCQNVNSDGACIVGSILLKGDYLTTTNQVVKFDSGGNVTGLEDFKYYDVQLDYYDVGLDIDMIILGRERPDTKISPANYSKWLGFKSMDNNLNLYEILCKEKEGNECVEIGFGKILHSLKKETK